jgi:hypothetical protein
MPPPWKIDSEALRDLMDEVLNKDLRINLDRERSIFNLDDDVHLPRAAWSRE